MSYDIDLTDPVSKETIQFEDVHHMTGGTYEVGGSREASLNITYNYAKHYYRVFAAGPGYPNGIRSIYGMTGAESIPVLEKAAVLLGDEVSENYWEATEGNAKRPLFQLIALAKMRPDGIWKGD